MIALCGDNGGGPSATRSYPPQLTFVPRYRGTLSTAVVVAVPRGGAAA